VAKQAPEVPVRKKSSPRRTLFFLFLILLILYVGIQLLSRTEGGKNLIEEQLSDALSQPVSVSFFEVTPSLSLHLQGVTSEGITISDWRLSLNPRFFQKDQPLIQKSSLEGVSIRTGIEAPLAHALGAILNPIFQILEIEPAENSDFSKTKISDPRTLFFLKDASLVFLDASQQEIAFLKKINLSSEKKAFESRLVRRFIFQAQALKQTDAPPLKEVKLELFSFAGSPFVGILKMEDQSGTYDSFGSTQPWIDLPIYFRSLHDSE
jgi:hypothetical protein